MKIENCALIIPAANTLHSADRLKGVRSAALA